MRTALTKTEEIERAHQTLLRGECFISKVPLSDKPYELVYHVGADSYIFIDKKFLKTREKETTDARISED